MLAAFRIMRFEILWLGLFLAGCGVRDGSLERAERLRIEGTLLEARAECDRLLARDPNNADALLLRGQLFAEEARLDEARNDFARVVEIRPHDAVANFYFDRLLDSPEDRRSKPRHDQQVDGGLACPPDSFAALAVASGMHIGNQAKREGDTYQDRYQKPDATAPEPVMPTQAPVRRTVTAYQKMRARLERQRREAAARTKLEREERPTWWHDEPPSDELPSDVRPRQVTSFGLDVSQLSRLPTSTTGVRSGLTPHEYRRTALIVQRVRPHARGIRTAASYRPFPATMRARIVPGNSPSTAATCADGLDNNGDGRFDQFDPVCWQDGLTPSSYSPDLAEDGSIPFTPLQTIAAPPPVIP